MDEPLNIIVGEQLSSVEFVQDYVQLRFDGPCLTVNAPMVVSVQGTRYKKGSPGFCESLCQRIALLVRRAVTIENEKIVIEFQDNSEIEISLKPEEQVSLEAAELTDRAKQIWVVW